MPPHDAAVGPHGRPDMDVYAAMNHIAAVTGAVNLGQAVPSDSPPALLEAAARAVRAGLNHYSPSPGDVALREAVADAARRRDVHVDPDSEVTILAGGTEAIAASLLGVLGPGDEVLTLEPFYDAYPMFAEMAGARLVTVPLERAGDRYVLDTDRLARAVTRRTRVLLINTPHNPTGMVLSPDELAGIARIADHHDLVVVSDEVYEELTYDGPPTSAGAVPGLRERTVVCSSASKTFCVSGWRVGWALAPAPLTAALRRTHRFLSYCAPTPLQVATAETLRWAMDTGYFNDQRERFRRRRDTLVTGLAEARLAPVVPSGGIVTIASVGQRSEAPRDLDALGTAEWVAREFGVVGLPLGTFYERSETAVGLLRFSFAKDPDRLDEAVRRLRGNPLSFLGRHSEIAV